MSIEYRRELISVLGEQLIPLIKEEADEHKNQAWHDAYCDLAVRLRLTADFTRQTPDNNPHLRKEN